MSTPQPITGDELAGAVRRAINLYFHHEPEPGRSVADPVAGAAFELTAPSTGQRFRVTVEEVPGWSDQMDRKLAAVTGSAGSAAGEPEWPGEAGGEGTQA